MTLRLLHLGDCHIRAGLHLDDVEGALAYVAQLAVARDVDAILLPGDLYERASTPVERQAVIRWLRALEAAGWHGPIILCDGNHDAPHDLSVWQVVDGVHVYSEPALVTLASFGSLAQVLSGPLQETAELARDPVDLLILPWPRRSYLAARGYASEALEVAGSQALADLIRGMVAARPDPSRPLVVMGHLSVTGAKVSSGQPLIGGEVQLGAGTLSDTLASYCALNHIHRHQEMAPGVVYAGSLTCHDHGEEGEEKGVVIVEVDGSPTARWEFVPVPCRTWVTVEAEVIEGQPREGIISEGAILTPVPADWLDGVVLRYRYRCTEAEAALFDHAEIRRRFAAAYSVSIVPEITRTERVRAADVAAARDPEAKLRAWGEATGTTVPDSAFARLREIQEETR